MVSAAVWQPKTVAVYWQQEEEKAERNLRFLMSHYTKDSFYHNDTILPLRQDFFCPKLFYWKNSEVILRKVPRKSVV